MTTSMKRRLTNQNDEYQHGLKEIQYYLIACTKVFENLWENRLIQDAQQRHKVYNPTNERACLYFGYQFSLQSNVLSLPDNLQIYIKLYTKYVYFVIYCPLVRKKKSKVVMKVIHL